MKKIFSFFVAAILSCAVTLQAEVTAQVAITVKSLSGLSDELLLLEMPGTSAGFDSGWDTEKMVQTDTMAIFLYAVIDGMPCSRYVTDDLNETEIVIQSYVQDADYTFEFGSLGGKQLYLYDAELDSIVPITEDERYAFTCDPGYTLDGRFTIRSEQNDLTGGDDPTTGGDDMMTAYFINSQGWDVRAYIYDWKDENWETVTDDVTTTKAEELINGFEVYMYQFSAGLEKPHFLFMNGTINDGAARTDYQPYSSDRPFFCLDGTLDSSGYANGAWYESPEAYLAAVNDTIKPTESETEHVQIGDLYYNLDVVNRTAAVTFQEEYSQSNYSGLATIVIPSTIEYNVVTYSVTNIGERAFTHCSDLTSVFIPNSIITIGRGAFSDSYNLTSLTIPISVLSIEEYAFEYCLSLTSITSEAITPPTCGTDVFSNVNTSIPLYVPTESVEAYQKADGWGEFTNILPIPGTDLECEPVEMSEDATICEGNMYIWRDMTYAETGVYRDTAWSVSGVCDSVHYVLNLTVQPQDETILDTVFITEGEAYDWNGTSLTESVTYRDTLAAFNGCDSIVTLILIVNQPEQCIIARGTCGDSLTWVLDCDSVLTISGNGAMEDYEYSGYVPWTDYKSDIKQIVIGSNVTSIGDFAFYQHSKITSINLPDNITRIGVHSIAYCEKLTYFAIPQSVVSIGEFAFTGCSGITSPLYNEHVFAYLPNSYSGEYSIPNGVETIAGGAFWQCKNLTGITIPNSVTSIGACAFEGCQSLTDITIPYGVTSIERQTFSSCSNLRSISLPNSLLSIGQFAFSTDHQLTSVNIPTSVLNIEKFAFDGCKGITSIFIPSSVQNIGEGAFKACFNLEHIEVDAGNSIYDSRENCSAIIETTTNTLICGCSNTTIPSSITHIGPHAFSECSRITSFEIPDNIIDIGNSAFNGCYSLVSLILYNNLTSIGNWAFYNCRSLIELSIPKSVTYIGEGAFTGCYGLERIICAIPEPLTIDSTAFKTVNPSIPLYVPEESVELYQNAEYWKEFTNIKAIGDSIVEPQPSDTTSTRTIYLRIIDEWKTETTKYAVWYWMTGKDGTWTDWMTQVDETIWSVQIPASTENVIFCRFNPEAEAPDWNYLWNQTVNLALTDSDLFTITGLAETALYGGVWSVYGEEPQPETGTFTVTFTPEDFAGQGTSGSGGAVAASKDGVKFSCVKAYGAETHLRCYKIDTITITSESTITAIDFTFEEKYQGNLEMHYEVGDKEWMTEVTAQVRITGVNVTVTKSEVVAPDTIVEFPDNSLWPILMDEYTLNKYAGNIVASFIQNDADRFLYVWDNSYTGGDITGKNFYGNKNGYLALVVYGSWSGCGYTLTGDGDSWKNVEPLRQAIIANPEKYYLHLAIKSTDNYSHSFYLFGTETTPFTLGDTTQYGGYIYSNFDRDGEWHEFYIPMERFVDELKNVKVEAGHVIFSALTQGVQGAELNLDAVFFCDEQMKNTLMASDHEILSGTCGDSLTWGLTKDSVLTIEGSGVMYWQGESAPWSNYTDEITSVSLPEGLTNIYNKAFAGCNITSIQIPSSVTSIGSDAFNSTKLASIDIPSGVIEMDGAFSYCRLLSAINVAEDNSKYASINGVLFDKSKTTLLIYPTNKADTTYSVPEGVTAIADRAFQYCSAIESMIVANSVKSIGYQAFWSCTFMHSLVLGTSLDTIGNGAFSGCNSLTSVTVNSASIVGKDYNGQSGSASQSLMMQLGWQVQEIIFGEDITRIGNYALYYPSKSSCKLRTFTFPANIAEIGKGAFYNCKFDELSVPQQVTSIGENAFKNIKQIWYDGSATGSPWGAKCVNNNCATVTTEVDVTDGSIDEWNNLPVDYVFESICPINAKHQALKSLKVYAQDTYINLLVEPDMTLFTDLSWVPFHVYLDTDNSDATGGDDLGLFTDRNTDIYLETALFVENEPYDYNPAVFKWWGEPGGSGWYWQDPTVEHDGNDFWGAIVGEGMLPVGNSQYVDGKFEIQLNRELIPATWDENKFGIGIEIENSWVTNGALPAITPTDDNPVGSTRKLTIQIYHSDITPEDTTDISEPEPIVTVFGKDVVIIDPTDSTATMDEVDVFGDSSLVYNPQENTLTFSSLSLEVGDSVSTAISYTGTETLTIVLCDSSTIFADTVISSMGDVVVTGDGVLVAEAVVPIIGAPTASILFDSVTMHVRSLKSPAAVRRRIRGIKVIDEDGGPALSGFSSVDYNKTAITPPDAQYGEIEVEGGAAGAPAYVINALYVVRNGENVVLTEFDLTAIPDNIPESIDTSRADRPLDPSQPMYNILGLQVDTSYKGVVIQNGRKYVQ